MKIHKLKLDKIQMSNYLTKRGREFLPIEKLQIDNETDRVRISEEKLSRTNKRFIFKPNDPFRHRWDIVIMVSAIFNCFSIPFKVAYKPEIMETTAFIVLNTMIDLVFFLDIIITFRTAFIDYYGNVVN
jgi:hypothetical protein